MAFHILFFVVLLSFLVLVQISIVIADYTHYFHFLMIGYFAIPCPFPTF